VIMIRSEDFGLGNIGGVNENGGSANRPDITAAGINAYCSSSLMLLGMRSLWKAKGVR